MPTPRRDTTAGRVYNDLRNLARRTGRGTDELMISYALERFLYRLGQDSPQRFVLKGGLLLACFGARRPTRDIDLLAQDIANDHASIQEQVTAVAMREVDDGVVFDAGSARTTTIREDADYAGVRVILAAGIATARLRLGVDVNFGDPVTPGAELIDFPQLLADKPFGLLGYPIATVIAEKLCTALVLGDLNTRERDFADMYRLLASHDIDGRTVVAALRNTATYRGARLEALSRVIGTLPDRRQAAFTAWRLKQGPDAAAYPTPFRDVIDAVVGFADPIVSGDAEAMRWSGSSRSWVEAGSQRAD